MSKVGEPIDVAAELKSIKARLESLEQRVLTIGPEPRLGPRNTYQLNTEALTKIIKKCKGE